MSERRRLTHRPSFWILFALVALAGVLFSVRYFPEAFPVVGLELEMDREGALESARALGERHGWGPDSFRQAATFGDEEPAVRTYVELEAGEEDSLQRLLAEGDYHPYQWRVRHFQEGETREVTIRFTPAGRAYAFRLTLPEDDPGAALPPGEAREIAETRAEADWGVDHQLYELVESSQEVRPEGRVDHTFVYLRRGAAIEDADFRLRLRVAGDELSEVRRFVRVPEAFSLRYDEMRAANTNIAIVASILFIVLFFLVGCGLGVFHLVRVRWLEWKAPLAWGGVVAGLMALGIVNGLPVAWFGYDTAVSSTMFLTQQVLLSVGALVVGTGFLALVFMAAESLDRRAFPDHPQQWRLWHRDMARSGPAVGRTAGGYLLAAVEVGFVVAFYLFAMRRQGWWMPSETLIHPDLLATYFPWLTAVATALFAGFWEESLFRAVPIAGAALIGARYGRKGLWIGAALVLQAVLFAAGHADYPQQPAYARLVELFLPALLWGIVYLYFGLVPVIIAHASYNLTLMSLPLWVSSAPGIWMDRAAVVLIGLIPLWVVLYHVARRGFSREAPAWALNGAWRPPAVEVTEEDREEAAAADPTARPVQPPPDPAWAGRAIKVLGALAVVGALLWAAGLQTTPDAPPLQVERSQAEAMGRNVLLEQGIELGDEWRVLPGVRAGRGDSHRFVWEEGGREVFRDLMGTYLREPSWHVRFATFTGPVEERAEEFHVSLGPAGTVFRVRHQLPEERGGEHLEEEEARLLAQEGLRERFGLDAERLLEVSADATNRPARQDWSFTWSDTLAYSLERGEARIRISLAGDRITDGDRFVHTPEEWERERSAQQTIQTILGVTSGLLYFLLFAGAAIGGLVAWARGRFDVPGALGAGTLLAVTLLLSMANDLPSIMEGAVTTESFGMQLGIISFVMGVVAVVLASALAIATGFVHAWGSPHRASPVNPLFAGGAIGLLVAGAGQAARTFGPRDVPLWPSYGGAGAYVPFLDPLLGAPVQLAASGLFLLLVLVGVDRFTDGWTRRKGMGVGGLILAGVAAPGPSLGEGVVPWLAVALAVAGGLFLLYRASRRLGLAWVPAMAATILVLDAVREASFQAYPGAAPGHLASMALLAGLAWAWTGLLSAERDPSRA